MSQLLPRSLQGILISSSDFRGILILAVQPQLLERATSATLAWSTGTALLSTAATAASELSSIAIARFSAGRCGAAVIRRNRCWIRCGGCGLASGWSSRWPGLRTFIRSR